MKINKTCPTCLRVIKNTKRNRMAEIAINTLRKNIEELKQVKASNKAEAKKKKKKKKK